VTETWTTLGVLDWTTRKFTDAGFGAPRLDAQILLAHALGCTRVQLYTQFDKPLGDDELARYRDLIKRRLAGEPAAYLIGEQEFWARPFFVDASVLIPRRDSELVIEVVLDQIGGWRAGPESQQARTESEPGDRLASVRVLDLCTGSGVLAVTLAAELPSSRVVATDVSEAACAVARRNAERAGVAERVDVRHGDLWACVVGEAFDVVVANPPYVRRDVIATLSAEVRHEPAIALDGGDDGLDVMRRLIAGLPAGVRLIAIEHGFDQADAVRGLVDATGKFAPAATRADLGGHPRVTWARSAP
jgi:release factor glutamine methyltransferase